VRSRLGGADWGTGSGDIVEFDAHVVDADCGVGISAVAVLVSHTSEGWGR
jgi:hypothetical protein